jgi:hypothetical protein
MTYVYICRFCKSGKHHACDEYSDVIAGDPELYGGGVCVCDHEAIYESPDDFWEALRERSNVA